MSGPGITFDQIPVDTSLPIRALSKTQQAAAQLTAALSQRALTKNIAVPTDDLKVRQKLRELGEPVTFFGEGPAERRDRLRNLLARSDGVLPEQQTIREDEEEEEYYTPGVQELLATRREIAEYSLPRHFSVFHFLLTSQSTQTPRKTNSGIKTPTRKIDCTSKNCGDRPVAIVRFSPDSNSFAAGSWSGTIKLFNSDTLEEWRLLKGHDGYVGGIDWSYSTGNVELASGGGEGDICLWNTQQDTPLSRLKGHTARVCKVVFHPLKQYILSASFDTTFRLWDLETSSELLLQDGHSDRIFAVSCSPDGSLVSSGGTDAVGRIWDLRTGRGIMILDGHSAAIHSMDWSVTGYQVATASADGTIKIWDVRKVACGATIAASTSSVSDVRFYKTLEEEVLVKDGQVRLPWNGTALVSSGYDGIVKIWSADSWSLIKSLRAHESKCMSVDISNGLIILYGRLLMSDMRRLVASGYDRTIKVWHAEAETVEDVQMEEMKLEKTPEIEIDEDMDVGE
ncbi:putative WD repeat-containing protein [Neolecta irregularis DAH-3]|uniref:Putative WD repeat-containing protein n=1 Tax=Neolecta irregularis (strain DAH-3) TaxID=1198029 RepID=A0A1U7LMQ3_NEOID|nr:putative WD repeat-containing protein [Neolecta irregularis DAH-3]|eukprot:OLL23946.1 putative WD repeat-containing protein [Neolecta irregularis DAH-3]